MKKLRLLLFEKCNRACSGCCNKDFDLPNLPVCKSLDGWDEVVLTGGEPMLNPELVINTAFQVPTGTDVYLYTAKVDVIHDVLEVLHFISGMTLTLHTQKDVEPFLRFNEVLKQFPVGQWSLRLNVFDEVRLPDGVDLTYWKVKSGIKWIKDCPLPTDEVFERLENPENTWSFWDKK